jgi:uncharacterized membrane protein
MRNKATVISTLLCLLPIALSILFYNNLPDQIAVHFDSIGNPDNYLPKALAAFGLPLLLAAINLYSHFRIAAEPKVNNTSASLRTFTKWFIPVVSLIIVPITLFMAMGKKVPVVMIGTAIAGLAIVISGNYLPKCKRNYTIGIKLPWTLDNDENWNHTHRFSGFVWTIGGIAIIINAFLGIPSLMIAIVACLIVIPFTYSYIFYRRHSDLSNRE